MSVTPHRDLRTGVSVWDGTPVDPLLYDALRHDLSTDVLVVGAGISGALVAEALSDAGLRVVVVDRRQPVSGATSASTALVLYETDVPLMHLARQIGPSCAARVWRRARQAVHALRERAGHGAFATASADHAALYLDGDVLDARGLALEAEARTAAGFAATFLTPPEVERRFGITGRAGVLSYDSLAVDPRGLTAESLRAATARGARIFSPTDVQKVESHAGGVDVETAGGPVVHARYLVFATGYELPHGVPHAGHAVASTWVIATRRQPRNLWPEHCFVWEASDPYLYLRPGPDGRVICGGEDESFSDAAARDALLPAKTRTLETRLAALFPQLDPRADYAWCGTFGLSDTGTPSIGAVPGMPSCFAVLGYGGNGITFSAVAAELIRNELTGEGDPDRDLFAFKAEG